MTSSAGGETKGEFLWDVWVGGGDFKVLLLKPEFMISPLVWILALLRLKIPMTLTSTFLFKRGSVVVGVKEKKEKTIEYRLSKANCYDGCCVLTGCRCRSDVLKGALIDLGGA